MSDENTEGNGNNEKSESAAVSVTADVMGKKIDVIETLRDGIDICIKNIGQILVNLILWALTIWIPYLNIGTTIGIFSGIIAKLSKDEPISYTEIFDPRYRKYMGEYLLTVGLMSVGVLIGLIFLIIPAFVLSIAWGFALILVIDKEKSPTEAIKLSNTITYGNKGRIFLVNVIVNVIFSVVQSVLKIFDNGFASFLIVILIIIQVFLSLGIQASMYKQLARDV